MNKNNNAENNNAENNNNTENSDHIENSNTEFDKNFINNISEELQAEMKMLQSYNNMGKMIGSFYMGLLDSVGEDLAIEFTEIFISNYVYNLFNSFGGGK